MTLRQKGLINIKRREFLMATAGLAGLMAFNGVGEAKNSIYNYELEKSVGELLMENNFTIATAESCTGGLVASRLTDFAGASNYFKGGVIAYTNEIKIEVLRVKKAILDEFGAVSRQTALEMAKNVREIFNSTFGISTTGVAGPSMSENKPVGLVFIAIAGENLSEVREFHFKGSRSEIKFQTADEAFKLLMEHTT